jgi:hypothetical protein
MAPRIRASGPTGAALFFTLKLFILVAIGFEALYLVLANLMLWVGLRPLLRWAEPEQLYLDYGSAYSLFPGDVHVKDFHLTNQDSSIQWGMVLEEGNLHIELGELFSRRVHMTRVRGSGLAMRFRLKLTPEEAEHPAARALPPILGYADPPIKDESVLPTPPEQAYRLWSAELDDVDAELRELWIHHYRFTGEARAQGGFMLRPLREARIDATGLTVRDGEVSLADRVVARAIAGKVICHIERFDALNLTFAYFLRRLRGHMDLYAEAPGAEFLSFYFPHAGLVFKDGSGATKLTGSIDGGVLAEGSELRTATDHLVLQGPDRTVTLGAEITGKVERTGGAEPSLRVTARLPEVRLSRTREDIAPLVADRVFVEVRTRTADVANLGLTSAVIDVPTARAGDLRILTEPSSQVVLGGFAELAAHLELDGQGKGGGLVRANARRARLRASDTTMTADLSGFAEIRGLDILARTARVPSATIAFKDLLLSQPGSAGAPISGEVKIVGGRMDRDGFEAKLKGEGSDAAALFDFAGVTGPLRWAPDLLNMRAFSSDGALTGKGGVVDLDLTGMKSGAVEGRGHLSVRDGRAAFALLLRAGPISAGISLGRGGSGISPFVGDDWFARELAAMGASPGKAKGGAGK